MSALALTARDAGATTRVRRLLAAVSTILDSAVARIGLSAAFLARHEGEHDERAIRSTLVELTQCGVQNPAMTNVPEWAGALVAVPDVSLALLDLLAEEGAAITQAPLVRLAFNRRGLIKVPMRAAGAPNLAGTWRAEGAAIRIGALSLGSATLQPHSLAILSTAAEETVNGAGSDVLAQVVKEGSIYDTARVLDASIFSSFAGDNAQPAGLGALATGDNTAVSTGATAAAIGADLRARLDQLLENGFGSMRTRWAMNTASAATLAQLFSEVQTRRTFLNIGIVSAPSIPAGVVFLADFAGVVLASDSPRFDASAQAIVNEEDAAPATDLSAAAPVRALWPTGALSYRLVWELDWVGAPGSIQTLTAVEW